METNPEFNKYMDRIYPFPGQWEAPSRCGIKVVNRKDGRTLVIVTEIYRQNPGTPVTEWCAPLAARILKELNCKPDDFIFIEHTPDLQSKLDFYNETFDQVSFDVSGQILVNPRWTRLTPEQVDMLMNE
ncbi:MAG: hypothetical protein WCO44_13405 [Bacteroidota bacterium]